MPLKIVLGQVIKMMVLEIYGVLLAMVLMVMFRVKERIILVGILMVVLSI